MIARLINRLARLEGMSAVPVVLATSFSSAQRLLRLVIAAHVGGAKSIEDVDAAEVQALGLRSLSEVRIATGILGWSARHNEAVALLLKSYGGDPAAGIPANRAALEAAAADLPESLRYHLDADASPDVLASAAEWVSL